MNSKKEEFRFVSDKARRIKNICKAFDSYCKDKGICLETAEKYYCFALIFSSESRYYQKMAEASFGHIGDADFIWNVDYDKYFSGLIDDFFDYAREKEKEKEYSVYIHILPNNSIYIGQTKRSLEERWQNGRGYKNNGFFNQQIKKYGWDNIDHLLFKDNLTKEEADTTEQDLIKFYSKNERKTGRVVLNIKHNGD